jgi:hypothetical protein
MFLGRTHAISHIQKGGEWAWSTTAPAAATYISEPGNYQIQDH